MLLLEKTVKSAPASKDYMIKKRAFLPSYRLKLDWKMSEMMNNVRRIISDLVKVYLRVCINCIL